MRRGKKQGIALAAVSAPRIPFAQTANPRETPGPLRRLRHPLAAAHVRHALRLLPRLLRRVGGRHVRDRVGGQPRHRGHAPLAGEAHSKGVLGVLDGLGDGAAAARRAGRGDGDVGGGRYGGGRGVCDARASGGVEPAL